MALNGFAEGQTAPVRAGGLPSVAGDFAPERYHVIFVDPPTFSNSKRMGENTFEVQRDPWYPATKRRAAPSPRRRPPVLEQLPPLQDAP